jgi:hypothetical protein
MRTMKWLATLLALIVAVFIAYKLSFPTYSYRYRLELALSVDGKIHTGSSVIEVTWQCGFKIADSGRCGPSLRGQAAVIDLGSRGVIVATLHNGEFTSPATAGGVDAVVLCANAFGNRSTDAEIPALPRLTGRRDLTEANFPRLVWFPDPADARSAIKIATSEIPRLIDPTARFTAAFVQITSEPVVIDIANKLPWYPALEREQKSKGALTRAGQFQLVYNMFARDN